PLPDADETIPLARRGRRLPGMRVLHATQAGRVAPPRHRVGVESPARTPGEEFGAGARRSSVAVRIRALRHRLASTAPQSRRQGRTVAPHGRAATRARRLSAAAAPGAFFEGRRGGPTEIRRGRADARPVRVPPVRTAGALPGIRAT